MAEVFDLFSEIGIVHADLKPDNILVQIEQGQLLDLKIIDFGSSFGFDNPSNISATTPEYLAPEVLDFIETK